MIYLKVEYSLPIKRKYGISYNIPFSSGATVYARKMKLDRLGFLFCHFMINQLIEQASVTVFVPYCKDSVSYCCCWSVSKSCLILQPQGMKHTRLPVLHYTEHALVYSQCLHFSNEEGWSSERLIRDWKLHRQPRAKSGGELVSWCPVPCLLQSVPLGSLTSRLVPCTAAVWPTKACHEPSTPWCSKPSSSTLLSTHLP